MRPTVRLGQFFGVDVGVHWTIGLIAAFLTYTLSGSILPEFARGHSDAAYLITALITSALFLASIVAHELGHSVVAIRDGIRVKGITLFALGGVASLEGEPATPGSAARIALAGPAVSIGLGAAGLGLAAGLAALGIPGLVVAALVWLGVINLSLAVFNLLPALPLDGGRVLQAYLWHRRGDRHQATITAAGAGRWIGWAVVGFGFWEFTQGGNGFLTMLVGWFVVTTARAEGLRARMERDQDRVPADPFGGLFGGGVPSQPGPWGPPPASPPYTSTPDAGGPTQPSVPAGAPPFSDGRAWSGRLIGPFVITAWPPPRAEDRRPGTGPVIDVTGRPADTSEHAGSGRL